MNRFAATAIVMGLCCAPWTLAQEGGGGGTGHASLFDKPFRVKAGDAFIDVEIGHAAPWYVDWDGDGVKDLLVGQFGKGKLRIYKNTGTDTAPKFAEDFKLFETREGLGSIPSG